MNTQAMSAEEIARIGQDIYDRQLKPLLEPEHNGKFCAINIENGDYAVADTRLGADEQLRARYPDEVFYLLKVGFAAACRIGRQW